jgi:anti-sigma28 factor (negative regulator of flagellin synthesis)
MKINETKAVADVGRVATPEAPVAPPKDRVTVTKSREVDAAVATAKVTQTADRPGRLKALEARVRAGEYHPDPSRVAEEILQDAEIEARLQSLLRH